MVSFLARWFGRKAAPIADNPDIDGQVMALLTNQAYLYAAAQPGFTSVSDGYRRAFTVKRKDMEAYIAAHEIKLEDYGAKHHWLRLFPEGDKWVVSQYMPPEKGPGYEHETQFNRYDEAWAMLLTKILANAGTGLTF